jgi:hypothetical protein
MNNTLFILLFTFLMEICSSQTSLVKSDLHLINSTKEPVDTTLLAFYRQYSEYTDPGEYAYLYEGLPDSPQELCRLIKSQYINPNELPMYEGQISKERSIDMMKYPTVKLALEGLLSYDSSGLVQNRQPENRLVLICRDNSILFASILKYRGIPARVRYGFASYLMPGFHASHVICEVWSEDKNRWMLVDPSTNMVNFSRDQFDFGNDVWLKLQEKEIDANLYGVPDRYIGLVPITMVVCTDAASILGTEYPTYKYPPILDYVFQNNNQLTVEHIETLNRLSKLMNSMSCTGLFFYLLTNTLLIYWFHYFS